MIKTIIYKYHEEILFDDKKKNIIDLFGNNLKFDMATMIYYISIDHLMGYNPKLVMVNGFGLYEPTRVEKITFDNCIATIFVDSPSPISFYEIKNREIVGFLLEMKQYIIELHDWTFAQI